MTTKYYTSRETVKILGVQPNSLVTAESPVRNNGILSNDKLSSCPLNSLEMLVQDLISNEKNLKPFSGERVNRDLVGVRNILLRTLVSVSTNTTIPNPSLARRGWGWSKSPHLMTHP